MLPLRKMNARISGRMRPSTCNMQQSAAAATQRSDIVIFLDDDEDDDPMIVFDGKGMTNHSNEYVCDACAESFINQSLLIKHLKQHTDPNHCCKCCGKYFPDKRDLIVHLKIHVEKETIKGVDEECSNERSKKKKPTQKTDSRKRSSDLIELIDICESKSKSNKNTNDFIIIIDEQTAQKVGSAFEDDCCIIEDGDEQLCEIIDESERTITCPTQMSSSCHASNKKSEKSNSSKKSSSRSTKKSGRNISTQKSGIISQSQKSSNSRKESGRVSSSKDKEQATSDPFVCLRETAPLQHLSDHSFVQRTACHDHVEDSSRSSSDAEHSKSHEAPVNLAREISLPHRLQKSVEEENLYRVEESPSSSSDVGHVNLNESDFDKAAFPPHFQNQSIDSQSVCPESVSSSSDLAYSESLEPSGNREEYQASSPPAPKESVSSSTDVELSKLCREPSLLEQLNLHGSPKNYGCDACTVTFSSKSQLAKHIKVHEVNASNNLKNYSAETSNLENDLRTHDELENNGFPESLTLIASHSDIPVESSDARKFVGELKISNTNENQENKDNARLSKENGSTETLEMSNLEKVVGTHDELDDNRLPISPNSIASNSDFAVNSSDTTNDIVELPLESSNINGNNPHKDNAGLSEETGSTENLEISNLQKDLSNHDDLENNGLPISPNSIASNSDFAVNSSHTTNEIVELRLGSSNINGNNPHKDNAGLSEETGSTENLVISNLQKDLSTHDDLENNELPIFPNSIATHSDIAIGSSDTPNDIGELRLEIPNTSENDQHKDNAGLSKEPGSTEILDMSNLGKDSSIHDELERNGLPTFPDSIATHSDIAVASSDTSNDIGELRLEIPNTNENDQHKDNVGECEETGSTEILEMSNLGKDSSIHDELEKNGLTTPHNSIAPNSDITVESSDVRLELSNSNKNHQQKDNAELLKENSDCRNFDKSSNDSKVKRFSCSLCCVKRSSREKIKAHMKKHARENSLKCRRCLDASKHIVSHNCDFCKKRNLNLNAHLCINLNSDVTNCSDCREPLPTTASSRKHFRIQDCSKCSTWFLQTCDTNELAATHLSNDAPLNRCPICRKPLNGSRAMSEHLRSLECSYCSISVRGECGMKAHLDSHTRILPIKCLECLEWDSRVHEIDKHVRSHDESELNLKCQKCIESSLLKLEMASHKRTHTNAKLVKCKFCKEIGTDEHLSHRLCLMCVPNRYFQRKCEIDEHMAVHAGRKVLKCKMFTHGKIRCNVCRKSFARKEDLANHKDKDSCKRSPLKRKMKRMKIHPGQQNSVKDRDMNRQMDANIKADGSKVDYAVDSIVSEKTNKSNDSLSRSIQTNALVEHSKTIFSNSPRSELQNGEDHCVSNVSNAALNTSGSDTSLSTVESLEANSLLTKSRWPIVSSTGNDDCVSNVGNSHSVADARSNVSLPNVETLDPISWCEPQNVCSTGVPNAVNALSVVALNSLGSYASLSALEALDPSAEYSKKHVTRSDSACQVSSTKTSNIVDNINVLLAPQPKCNDSIEVKDITICESDAIKPLPDADDQSINKYSNCGNAALHSGVTPQSGTEGIVATSEEHHSCEKCHKHFTSKPSYYHVKRRVRDSRIFPKCCEIVPDRSAHLRWHSIEPSMMSLRNYYSCEKCSKKFSTAGGLNRHLAWHTIKASMTNTGNSYSCEKCGKQHSTEVGLSRHLSEHTIKPSMMDPGNSYSCEKCGKQHSTEAGLSRHLSEHTIKPSMTNPGNSYQCEKCHRTFSSSQGLTNHVTIGVRRPHRCEKCCKKFSTEISLSAHLKWHSIDTSMTSPRNSYSCEKCHKSFDSRRTLIYHKESHLRKPYQCEKCRRTFPSMVLLRSHALKLHNKSFCLKSKQMFSNYVERIDVLTKGRFDSNAQSFDKDTESALSESKDTSVTFEDIDGNACLKSGGSGGFTMITSHNQNSNNLSSEFSGSLSPPAPQIKCEGGVDIIDIKDEIVFPDFIVQSHVPSPDVTAKPIVHSEAVPMDVDKGKKSSGDDTDEESYKCRVCVRIFRREDFFLRHLNMHCNDDLKKLIQEKRDMVKRNDSTNSIRENIWENERNIKILNTLFRDDTTSTNDVTNIPPISPSLYEVTNGACTSHTMNTCTEEYFEKTESNNVAPSLSLPTIEALDPSAQLTDAEGNVRKCPFCGKLIDDISHFGMINSKCTTQFIILSQLAKIIYQPTAPVTSESALNHVFIPATGSNAVEVIGVAANRNDKCMFCSINVNNFLELAEHYRSGICSQEFKKTLKQCSDISNMKIDVGIRTSFNAPSEIPLDVPQSTSNVGLENTPPRPEGVAPPSSGSQHIDTSLLCEANITMQRDPPANDLPAPISNSGLSTKPHGASQTYQQLYIPTIYLPEIDGCSGMSTNQREYDNNPSTAPSHTLVSEENDRRINSVFASQKPLTLRSFRRQHLTSLQLGQLLRSSGNNYDVTMAEMGEPSVPVQSAQLGNQGFVHPKYSEPYNNHHSGANAGVSLTGNEGNHGDLSSHRKNIISVEGVSEGEGGARSNGRSVIKQIVFASDGNESLHENYRIGYTNKKSLGSSMMNSRGRMDLDQSHQSDSGASQSGSELRIPTHSTGSIHSSAIAVFFPHTESYERTFNPITTNPVNLDGRYQSQLASDQTRNGLRIPPGNTQSNSVAGLYSVAGAELYMTTEPYGRAINSNVTNNRDANSDGRYQSQLASDQTRNDLRIPSGNSQSNSVAGLYSVAGAGLYMTTEPYGRAINSNVINNRDANSDWRYQSHLESRRLGNERRSLPHLSANGLSNIGRGHPY